MKLSTVLTLKLKESVVRPKKKTKKVRENEAVNEVWTWVTCLLQNLNKLYLNCEVNGVVQACGCAGKYQSSYFQNLKTNGMSKKRGGGGLRK